MRNLIIEWYDEMISLNEHNENYEACSYFKTSKDAYLNFEDEGTVLFRGKRYDSTEIINLINNEKGPIGEALKRGSGVKGV
tara:strand:- start:7839 stop:8081 length:243 start_codon:yes stop_codon:yes gene_type:complete